MAEGDATYAGTTRSVDGSYSNSWGSAPGVVRLSVGPNFGQLNSIGDLDLRFRDSGFTLRDVLVVDPATVTAVNSPTVVDFTALDRRWRWQDRRGRLYGDYNRETKNGNLLREKSPRDLATMVLIQLENHRFSDVSGLPTTGRPYTHWEAERPLDALTRLVEEFGCVICFDPLTDRIRIARRGVGASPLTDKIVSRSSAVHYPIPADGVRIVTGVALFENEFLLGEPVGLEVDGSYQKLDDLSYKVPNIGWASMMPGEFDGITTTYTDRVTGEQAYHRDLAKQSVWRCYRTTGLKGGGWTPNALKGNQYEPKKREDIGPFADHLLGRDSVTGERLPNYCYGEFADEKLGYVSTKKGRWPGGFSINDKLGIVTFDQPAFIHKPLGSDARMTILKAEMVLRTAYSVQTDGNPIHYEYFQGPLGSTGAGDLIEHHEELIREIGEIAGQTSDNLAKVTEAAVYYAQAIIDQLRPAPSDRITYGGIRTNLRLDGRLQSLVWSFGANTPPTTQAAWNCETNRYVIPFDKRPEARIRRKAQAEIRRAAAQWAIIGSRVQASIQRRGP